MPLPRRAAVFVLALVAASIVTIEVLLTRVLSVATHYGLVFIVLSLAMLGLAGGSLDAIAAERAGAPLRPWIARRLALFAGATVLATIVVVSVPVTFLPSLSSFASVVLVAGACALPMTLGGSVVARLLGEGEVPVAILYGVDLASAAAGAVVPLALLGPLSGPSALVAVGGVLALAAAVVAERRERMIAVSLFAVATALVVVTETTSAGLVVLYPKGVRSADDEPPALYSSWNALAHVELRPFALYSENRVLWAASPKTPKGAYEAAYAMIDGDAGTFVQPYTDASKVHVLQYDAVTSAHWMRPSGTACVIGAGAGRDVLAALYFGHDHVLGVEINPGMVDMLHRLGDRFPLVRDPRVELVVGDGRAELSRSHARCRVLQATLVDTWVATSAGAFAHSEATLYTLEAWRLFLRRVEPDGVLTFSRWYDAAHVEETARLVSLAVASLLDRGIASPRRHLALVASNNVATILVSPAPFSARDIEVLHGLADDLGHSILLAPDKQPTDALLDRLVQVKTIDALAREGAPDGLDTSPPTDDRPFFFQLRAPSAWLHPLEGMRVKTRGGVLAGNARAMFQLVLSFAAVLLVGVALLGPTLVRSVRARPRALPGGASAIYFAALGAGFMMAEIALVQRMHVVLGHPTYALVVVLAGLLVATGAGSALSPRVIRSRAAVSAACIVATALLVLLPRLVVKPLANATLESSLFVRAAWTGGCSAAIGLALGLLFPAGLRYVARARGAALALAVNGFASVIGSILAVALSVAADIPTTFAFAGLLYAIAAASGPIRWAPVD